MSKIFIYLLFQVFIGIVLFEYFDIIITGIVLERVHSHNVALFILIFILTLFYCVDFVFHIIFIISAHKVRIYIFFNFTDELAGDLHLSSNIEFQAERVSKVIPSLG